MNRHTGHFANLLIHKRIECCSFNLTSEEVATQLAIKLKAEKMIGFCSEQGVLNSEGEIISELFPNDAQARIDEIEKEGGTPLRQAFTAPRRKRTVPER